MYLDWSLTKILTLTGIVLCLSFGVYATYLGKMNMFGSTPYFYSIEVGARYALESLVAAISNNALVASAAAAFGQDAPPPVSTGGTAPGIPVLTYHRIIEDANDVNNVTVSRFREQMTALSEAGWQTVSLAEFEAFMAGEKELPEKSFLLTFDDGAKQSFYPVDPILRSLGYEAVIYIIVESSYTTESTYYMSPEEVRWMLGTGRWAIGSHSYDGHRPYATDQDGNTGIYFADRIWKHDANRTETPEEFISRVKDDLSRAKTTLEDTYGVRIDTFAFPLGNETGVEGANNFPEGAAITEREARSIYDWGFVQTNNQTYTFNFPKTTTPSFSPAFATTTKRLSADFLAHRIHVDYDWDGERILSIMENGLAKQLPYEDNFAEDRGWISAWGSLEIGRNNLVIAAEPAITSASVFLDGTALWKKYSFDASVNWTSSHISLLADVLDSKTYHSCAFSEGVVRLQRTVDGETTTLAEKKDPRIAYGPDKHPGIRVRENVIECTWEFESLIEDYTRDFSGGVGIQVWDPELGKAQLQVASIIARPL